MCLTDMTKYGLYIWYTILCYNSNGRNNMDADDSFIRKGSHMEQRHKLGLSDRPRRSNARQFLSEPTSELEKVEVHRIAMNEYLKIFISGTRLENTRFYFDIV